MNSDMLRTGQKVLNVLWVVLAVSFFVPMGGLGGILRSVFVLMLAAHVIEFLVFRRTLAKLGGSMGQHLVKVLLYGFFHIQLVKLEAGEASASS